MTLSPFDYLIQLKQQEATLAIELPKAKAEAIAFYKANPVLTDPKKLTGQFDSVEGQKLGAKLAWKIVSTTIKNPDYQAKSARLTELQDSLAAIHKEELALISEQIASLKADQEALLENKEVIKIKEELLIIPPTLEGKDREELTVTLPKNA